MSASFQLYKYTGKDCAFGTPVSSIGIKRIDAAVPAVYGDPIVPGDDVSDVNTYCLYRPDVASSTAYSFEAVWKMVLTEVPSNQVSNIRIYPAQAQPSDANIPIMYIGNSISYTRPTNEKSVIAVNNIWDYDADNPFYLTVNGVYGQNVDEQITVTNYVATLGDIGFGNVIYMNGVRQFEIPIVVGNTWQITNQDSARLDLQIYDLLGTPISSPYITYGVDGQGNQFVTINAVLALYNAYPNGFMYGDANNPSIGGAFAWLDLSADPITIEEYNVDVRIGTNGVAHYYLNDVRNPVLNFRSNMVYRFYNHNGDTDPMRFLNVCDSTRANTESQIIVDGITVENGGTVDEVITVYPSQIIQSGQYPLAYQSVTHSCFGNTITNINTALCGNYNINTVGGGIVNPLAAGETDYIYMQVEVSGDSTVGQVVPDLIIEYDES